MNIPATGYVGTLRREPLFSPDDGGTPPTGKPAMDKPRTDGETDKITLTRAEYDAMLKGKVEFEKAKERLADLEQVEKHVNVLLEAGNDPNKVWEAQTSLLKRKGYTDRQILEMRRQVEEAAGEEDGGREEGGNRGRSGRESMDEEVTTKLGSVEKQLQAERTARLRGMLNDQLDRALQSGSEVGKMVDGLVKMQVRSNPKAKEDEIRTAVTAQIRKSLNQASMTKLTELASSGRGWQDGFIEEAAKAASSSVIADLRTVIGDPSLLGRSSETVSARDEILSSLPDKPVPAPKYKKGMTEGEAEQVGLEWATDALVRGLAETEAGNESRV